MDYAVAVAGVQLAAPNFARRLRTRLGPLSVEANVQRPPAKKLRERT
jgi:hypothetical protein